ncbi:MAG TPA: winged helix-turn-helix domain-containing protein [Acidobacteriaceae bacterium]|nr:winged helix-turn-helix domain-containing protein [Acidobacteriaceae bacterium]
MIFRFDRFQADDSAFRLIADGAPVPLEPKALRLLLYLIQNRGRLVRKQELLDAVWADAAVTESALTRSVGLLRKALDDDSREPRFIETVPTAGYRFIAHVETTPPPEPATTQSPTPPAPAPQPQISGQPRSHLGLAAIIVACLASVVTVWLLASRLHSGPIRSLAVLPLANLSGDPSQEYFADGMTDELITELARIPNLRVVSRTSVMADKGSRRPLPEIARQLDVDAIVEGSIVRSGDRIRITAQLIDARTDRHLWAQSFEGPASDVLSLQDSVAQQIATQARVVLTPPPPHPPVNPAAHDAYLRGLYFFNKQDLSHSLESFQQAIALDPAYASAYAGYASALDAASTFEFGTPEQLMPKALAAAQRAIQLDPQNGEAYTALGSVQTIYQWDWTAAEQNLTRGISLNPNDSIAEFKYAVYLDAVGRSQEAVTHMRRALQLDPLSFLVNRRLGVTLYLAGQYDAALAQLQRAAEMEHRPGTIDNYLSLIYEQKGDHDQAVQHDLIALHEDQPQLDTGAILGVYRQHGWQSYWRARSHALLTTSARPCTAYEIGIDDLRVNDLDHAFDSFQHALDNHCFYMALIRVDPLLDSVRHDSRYAALLTRMHQ